MGLYTSSSGVSIYGGSDSTESVSFTTTDVWPGVSTQEGYMGTLPSDTLWDAYGHEHDCYYCIRTDGTDATPSNPSLPKVYMHASGSGGSIDRSINASYWGDLNHAWITTNDAQYYGDTESWYPAGYDTGYGVDNYCGERIGATMDEVQRLFPDELDWDNGFVLEGQSMGGRGCWVQCMILPDRWRRKIIVVDSTICHTYPKALGTWTYSGAHSSNPFTSTIGPTTDAIWDTFDFPTLAATDTVLQNMIFYFMGNPRSNLGCFDPRVVKACQDNKIAHVFTWDGDGAHQFPQIGSPLRDFPKTRTTLNTPFMVFTNSSGDWPHSDFTNVDVDNVNENGHVNLGLDWDFDNISEDATEVRIPIRYQRQTSFPEDPGPPDMATTITVDVTPRRTRLSANTEYSWSYDTQSGTATTDTKGLLTVNLSMSDSASFEDFVVTK